MIQAPIPEQQARITHVRTFAYVFRASILGPLLPEGLERLLAEVSEEARRLLERAPAPDEWVSTEVMAEIRLAYRRLFHLEAARIRGVLMIEEMLKSGLLAPGTGPMTPERLLSAIVEIFPATHRGGLATLDACGPGRARMSIWALFPYPQYLDTVVPEILRTGLLHIGCPGVKVEYDGPQQTGHPYWNRYRITW